MHTIHTNKGIHIKHIHMAGYGGEGNGEQE